MGMYTVKCIMYMYIFQPFLYGNDIPDHYYIPGTLILYMNETKPLQT